MKNFFNTPKAREDLSHTRENAIETWGNVELDENVLQKITQSARSLTTFPYMDAEISAITGITKEPPPVSFTYGGK